MLALGGVTLLTAAGLGLAASDPLPGAPGEANAAPRGRPNIVLIQSDDQTYTQLSQRAMPKTKRLLERRGTLFTDYIASTPQCCPSRASLITGQYAHNHGATSNRVGYPGLIEKGNVLPVWLRQAGYRTMHVGKFLNGYERFTDAAQVPPGWSQWRLVLGNRYYKYDYFVNGRVLHHGRGERDHVTHVLNRDAARLVHRYAPKRRPFYLQLDERAPHAANKQSKPHGRCARGAPIPESADKNLFRNEGLPKPPSFNEEDMSDKPSFLRSAPKIGSDEKRTIRKSWRCGLAALRGVDRGVGKIYDAVRDAGELRKTVFIFSSDNGLFHGQHRRRSKILPYEEALRVPLLIRAPKRYRGGAPRVKRSGRTVGNIDLAPTILDLAGARPCSASGNCRTMDGRSLMPLLRRSSRWPRGRGLLTEYRVGDVGRFASCEFAGIRTRDTLYVRHFRVVEPGTSECVSVDQRERYNLRRDPFELHNLCFGGSSDSCPLDDKQLDLEVRLSRLRSCAGIAGRDDRVGGRPFCE